MTIYKKINEYLDNQEKNKYNNMIDYTKISDSLTNDKLKEMCKEAEENNFYSVCVLPDFITKAKSFLKSGTVKISALVDYPKGESGVKQKISEIDKSIVNGADEIDVVVNYNLIKNPEYHEELEEEIRKLSEYCHREGSVIKTIIEIGSLNYQELESICKMCIDSNVDCIMTSTGKLPNDGSFESKIDKVKFMRKILPDDMKIKFSGGVRHLSQIKELSGIVDRIGTSFIIK